MVDFQKGERSVVKVQSTAASSTCFRQINMDYSICGAIQQLQPQIDKLLLLYDVNCEWSIHFKDRVKAGPFLSVREDLNILYSIGKFHLGAHIKECFPLFSLNFVKGAGQLDGEIIETLWSSLNEVSGSTRGMTKAHRQEILDDHMNDSNWKKLVKSREFMCLFRIYIQLISL